MMLRKFLTFLGQRKAIIAIGSCFFIAGIIFWGGFNTAMDATDTLTFCTSCHEMRDTVFQEYKQSVHYSNRSGVRAICSDCHVPHGWIHRVARDIQATGELWYAFTGKIGTPEKFEAHRLEMAKSVWAEMKATDSRECRNCHSFAAMSQASQRPSSWGEHSAAIKDGQTCIDCHKGIVHKDVSKQLEKQAAPASFDMN